MERSEWLKSLKAGDTVAIAWGYRGDSYDLHKVSHVTPKHGHIVLENGRKFDSKGWGHEIGRSGYNHASIQPYDDKVKAAIERDDLKRRLGKWSDWLVKFIKETEDVEVLKTALTACRAMKPLTKPEEQKAAEG